MRQQTLAAQTGFEKYGRKTKRERFLEEMEQIVPWAELQALVEAHYPKGENGRPPMGLSLMLRVYFLQQWFNQFSQGLPMPRMRLVALSNPACVPARHSNLRSND